MIAGPIEPRRRSARRWIACAGVVVPATAVAVLVSLAHKPPTSTDQATAGALACNAPGGNVSVHRRLSSDSAYEVTVYKSPTCTCCTAWVDHVRRSGFTVVAIDTADLDAVEGAYREAYDVLAFTRGSPPRIFATH